MNRTLAYLLGPELVWALAFALASTLVARNHPPTEALSRQLESVGMILPLVTVVLSFVPFAWAPGGKWWLFARILVIGLIGVFAISLKIVSGINYQDSRNSGLFAAWVMFVGAGLLPLIAGGVVAVVFLITKWRVLPFLKWGLIVVAILGLLWGIICWLASLDTGKSKATKEAETQPPTADQQ